MKKILFSLIAGAMFIFQTGCEKDTDSPNKSVEGLWIGYYMVEGEPARGQQYFSFAIKPDGALINDSKGDNIQHLSIGTWSLSGEQFTATTTCVYGHPSNIGIQETHTATFKNGKFSGGEWANVAPRTGTGTFTLTKVE